MMMSRTLLSLLTVASLAACGGGDDDQLADLDRDLAMPPADSLEVISDLPAPDAAPVAPVPQPPAPARPVANRPAPPPPPAPVQPGPEPTTVTLGAGTVMELRSSAEITSRTNKAGETFTATVAQAVTDANGRTLVPAGATVTMSIVELAPAANRGDTTGTLVLRATRIAFVGESYELNGRATTVAYELKGRGVTAGGAATVGAGAAAGAVAGRVLGGGSRGTIVGGVIGAATGAAIAAETADRDVVIAEGTRIVIALSDPLVVPRP
jgi:hypothetical protein